MYDTPESVCVCEREKERERESETIYETTTISSGQYLPKLIIIIYFITWPQRAQLLAYVCAMWAFGGRRHRRLDVEVETATLLLQGTGEKHRRK